MSESKSAPNWKNLPLARVSPSVFQHLRQGEPWVFRASLQNDTELQSLLPAGGWVRISASRKQAGLALYDPTNAIALRVLDSSAEEVPVKPLLRRRLFLALQIRRPIWQQNETTSGFRLLHGEGDRLPGLVADYYQGLLVFRPDCEAWLPFLPQVIEYLQSEIELQAVYLAGKQGQFIQGQLPLPHVFHEHGLKFHTDPSAGQKTGFFLDMRPNRRYLQSVSSGLSVLNCFSYTGGFSLYALRGGASRVINLDISSGAVNAAKDNYRLNQLAANDEDFQAADVFDWLQNLPPVKSSGRGEFDLIILDPPSFAHSQSAVPNALAAYRRLNQLALERLGSGQYLVTASCSSRVSPEQFSEAVSQAAVAAKRQLRLLHSFHAGADHPLAIGSGIGHYLKFHHYLVE